VQSVSFTNMSCRAILASNVNQYVAHFILLSHQQESHRVSTLRGKTGGLSKMKVSCEGSRCFFRHAHRLEVACMNLLRTKGTSTSSYELVPTSMINHIRAQKSHESLERRIKYPSRSSLHTRSFVRVRHG
jgi:hypothetical protein